MCAPVLADGQGFNNLKNTCKTSTFPGPTNFQSAGLRLKRRILLAFLKVRYKKHEMLNLLNDCPQRCFILQQKQNKVRSQVLYSKTFLPISIEKNEIRALHALPPPQALVVSWEGHDFERACGGGSSTLERGD